MKHTLSTTLAIALGLGIGTLSTTAKQAHADTINNYTVQAGDTLSALAQRYNSDINTIATTNHLSNPNLIFVGQHLVIDSKNNANSSTSSYKAVTAPVKQYPVNNTTATNSNVKTAENGSQANTPHYQYVQAQVPSTMQSNAQQRSWNELSSQEKQAWQQQPQQTNSGSVHDQFIANGGTEAMWNNIVIPESGGNPNAVNGRYRGLGQTDQEWCCGSVAHQTQGMINYAVSRYGSINNAIAFRQAHGWW